MKRNYLHLCGFGHAHSFGPYLRHHQGRPTTPVGQLHVVEGEEAVARQEAGPRRGAVGLDAHHLQTVHVAGPLAAGTWTPNPLNPFAGAQL